MTATATRPAFRKPWEHGAKAYPQADSLTAMVEGMKRRRNPDTVHVAHEGLVGETCAHCGKAFDAAYPANAGAPENAWVKDEGGYAYVDYDPRTKKAVARHYYCAWQGTMKNILDLRDLI